MGQIINDKMIVKEPDLITISGLPNFVEFKSGLGGSLTVSCTIAITPKGSYADLDGFKIGFKKEYRSPAWFEWCYFEGTGDKQRVGETTFYVDSPTTKEGRKNTLYNLYKLLLSDSYLKTYMNIDIFQKTNGESEMCIRKKSPKSFPDLSVNFNNGLPDAHYTRSFAKSEADYLTWKNAESDMSLNIYEQVLNGSAPGKFITTLRKTYTGEWLWFNLNALLSQYKPYNIPGGTRSWLDAGTGKGYFFSATAPDLQDSPFYWSDTLYVLNGYGKVSGQDHMVAYAYTGDTVPLLSDKPRTPYVYGQKEYLNFLLGNLSVETPHVFSISYRAYTAGRAMLGEIFMNEVNATDLYTVNTCVLDIDKLLDTYPDAGIVRVALVANGNIVSNDLEYEILPECLHSLRQFTFLNRFGGWESFNFDAGTKEEIKPSVETYNKTLTPSYRRGEGLEEVYSVSLSQMFTVEAAPVTNEVAEWLKEFVVSAVKLDGEGNYIILEDFSLSVSADNFNMQRPILKYRSGENYG